MLIGRVEGSATASVKNDRLVGIKLLVIQPVRADGDSIGASIVAEDAIGAGLGQLVLVVTGGAARSASKVQDAPVDAVVIAIVDELHAGAGRSSEPQ